MSRLRKGQIEKQKKKKRAKEKEKKTEKVFSIFFTVQLRSSRNSREQPQAISLCS